MENIDAETYQWKSTSVNRCFLIDNNIDLNLKIEFDANRLLVDFNFHHKASDALAAARELTEASALTCYRKATEFMRNVYNIEIDDSQQIINADGEHRGEANVQ